MKIQFKKLVWAQTDCDLFCSNIVADFSISFHKNDSEEHLFLLVIVSEEETIMFKSRSSEECRNHAQKWLEEQLTKFIETSENPAQ